MCTREEVRIEVEASEKRMEAQLEAIEKRTKEQIDQIRDEILDKKWTDYNVIGKSFSQWGAEVRELKEQFKEHAEREEKDREKLHTLLEKLAQFDIEAANEIVTAYKGILSIKNFSIGIATVITAFTVVGASITYVIKRIVL